MPKSKIRGKCSECGTGTTKKAAIRCAKCNYAFKKVHADLKKYRADWHRLKKYGLTAEEFEAFWIVFRGKCGICKNDLKLPIQSRGQPLDVVAVDHDHVTGQVRGLLCNACNKGLGLFKDNPEIMKNAIRWVSK